MAWTTVWDHDNFAGLQAIVELNRYIDAINERNVISGGTALSAWVAGDSLQDHAKIAAMQSAAFAFSGTPSGTFWVPPGPFSGVAWSSGGTYGAQPWDWVNAAYVRAHALGGNTDYTRKYPREIALLSSTTYTDGSAFANGHVARLVNTVNVYTRTAGAWVLTAGAFPDVITNFGVCQAGDYLGPWLFNEMRDVIRLFSGVEKGSGWFYDSGDIWDSGGSPLYPTAVAARAAAVARFANTGNSGSGSFYPQASASEEQNGGLNYTAGLVAYKTYQKVILAGGSPYIGASYEVYVPGINPGGVNVYESPPGYTEHVWNLAATSTLAVGTNKSYAGNNTAPSWPGSDPAYPGTPQVSRGYTTFSGAAVKASVARPSFVYT